MDLFILFFLVIYSAKLILDIYVLYRNVNKLSLLKATFLSLLINTTAALLFIVLSLLMISTSFILIIEAIIRIGDNFPDVALLLSSLIIGGLFIGLDLAVRFMVIELFNLSGSKKIFITSIFVSIVFVATILSLVFIYGYFNAPSIENL